MADLSIVQPAGWPRPRGYANGMLGDRILFVGGMIGWDPITCAFSTDDLAEQFRIALENVIAVVRAAGGAPEHVARMTVYVTDLYAYRASRPKIGEGWRAVMGKHFPAMAVIGVDGLVEPHAKVEIEATCVLPKEVERR